MSGAPITISSDFIGPLVLLTTTAAMFFLFKWHLDEKRLIHAEELPGTCQRARHDATGAIPTTSIRRMSRKQLAESISWTAVVTLTAVYTKVPAGQLTSGITLAVLIPCFMLTLIFYCFVLAKNKAFDIEFLTEKHTNSKKVDSLLKLKRTHDRNALGLSLLPWAVTLLAWSFPYWQFPAQK